jgi:predicted phosphodiesterase
MRVAVFSDIHGNPVALDAVLADIERQADVDGYVVLGDLAAQGYDPSQAIARLARLPNARFVRGNTDRWVVHREWSEGVAQLLGIDGPMLPPAELAKLLTPEQLPLLILYAEGIGWTHGHLAAGGWLDWLAQLPLEHRFALPDGTRVLAVHVAPGRDHGPGVDIVTTDDELAALIHGCEADLVLCGDTHWPCDRRVGSVRVVNPGSVSNPRRDFADDVRPSYAMIDADSSDYRVTLQRAELDLEALMDAVRASHFYPNPEWLIGKYRTANG